MSGEMPTRRHDLVRVIDASGRVVLTVADSDAVASVILDPDEAEQLGRSLLDRAYVAEHG